MSNAAGYVSLCRVGALVRLTLSHSEDVVYLDAAGAERLAASLMHVATCPNHDVLDDLVEQCESGEGP